MEAGKKHEVLSGVNLSIDAGEVLSLVGASGSGKSTLLNLLGGIDRPSAGDIRMLNQSLVSMQEPNLTIFRRQHIGYIYQLFNLIPTLSVAENIALPLVLNGTSHTEKKCRTDLWLNRVGLDGRQGAFPDQLSGGEQQRVAIARALIHRPSIVLADEPTGNLDASNGRKILDLLIDRVEQSNQKQTLLIVTHSQEVAERTQSILHMQAGKVAELTQYNEVTAW